MVNVKVQEFKINIGKKKYTFRLDFNALINFENKYGKDGMILFNNFLNGQNIYDCVVKILSCSCVEEQLDEEYIKENLSFNFTTMRLLDEITFSLVDGLLEEKEEVEEKQEEKN